MLLIHRTIYLRRHFKHIANSFQGAVNMLKSICLYIFHFFNRFSYIFFFLLFHIFVLYFSYRRVTLLFPINKGLEGARVGGGWIIVPRHYGNVVLDSIRVQTGHSRHKLGLRCRFYPSMPCFQHLRRHYNF